LTTRSLFRSGNRAARTASKDTAGFPFANRTIPGALSIAISASRGRLLNPSFIAPSRRTIARSGRDARLSVDSIPVAIASTDTSTATALATPMQAASDGPGRLTTERRLTAVIRMVWRMVSAR
jgi:hypothetical protein